MKGKGPVYDEDISVIKGIAALLILLLPLVTFLWGFQLEMGKRLESTHKTTRKKWLNFLFQLLTCSCVAFFFFLEEERDRNHEVISSKCP